MKSTSIGFRVSTIAVVLGVVTGLAFLYVGTHPKRMTESSGGADTTVPTSTDLDRLRISNNRLKMATDFTPDGIGWLSRTEARLGDTTPGLPDGPYPIYSTSTSTDVVGWFYFSAGVVKDKLPLDRVAPSRDADPRDTPEGGGPPASIPPSSQVTVQPR